MLRRWSVFAGGLALLACGADDKPTPVTAAAQSQPRAPTIVPTDAQCRECHDVVASAWAPSRHHLAFENPDFQRSYTREPTDFCRNCHAPALTRHAALRLDGPAAEQLGVGCIDCHVDPADPEQVITGGVGASGAPHQLARITDFGTRSCARCHEFEFPPTSRRPPGTMMQTTMREHQRSGFADRSCASCHMPKADHGFASTRSPESLRRAVEIVATREHDDLLLELTPIGVGHAFPTGDLYRRLELHAELRDADGQLLADATRYLARQFPPWRHANGRINNQAWHEPVPDDRLSGPTQVRLELGDHAHADGQTRLIWWIDYERVDARNDLVPDRSTLASELRLAEGEL